MSPHSLKQKPFFLTFLFLLILFPALSFADAEKIFRENNRAVVVVVTFDKKGTPLLQGSGFIVRADGAIVTNYHFISNAAVIKVKAGDKVLDVEGLLHTDKENDVVILKAKGKNLPTVKLGDAEKVTIGEKVYVISSPEGLENTISDGILSGVREIIPENKVLQITAPISQGSSGGAVFNKDGKVIGVATLIIVESQNLNFAMPVNLIKDKISLKKIIALKDIVTEKYTEEPRDTVKTYEIVINPQYDLVRYFREDLAPVKIGSRWGFIDKKGKIVIDPHFDKAYSFSEGLANVEIGDWDGFIDKKGTIVISPQFDEVGYAFSEGLASVKRGSRWGFIDKKGTIVISPQFDEVRHEFSEGLMPVKIGGKWGFIDKKGKIVIDPQFDDAYPFSEGLANVGIGGRWGFIDKKGKIVISPQFDSALAFHEGLASVDIGGRTSFIDKKGRYVINPQFDSALSFQKGLAPVKIDGRWGFINKKGKIVINPQFDFALPFFGGLAPIEIDGRWGFISK